MNSTRQQQLTDMLDYLIRLTREGAWPEDARTGLRLLQQRYPNTWMELLWEHESYDQSVHYDILLHLPNEGTVSLSFCPERTLPWPMRGVHRWSEGDLVRVNNTVLTVGQAIAYLDCIWDEARIINRLVDACLILETLDRDPVQLSDVELQLAMDVFRRAHKLHKAEDTYHWIEQHGMTHERFERYVTDEAIVAKLRERVSGSRVEEYFEAHRANFETAWVACIEFADEESACRLYGQIRSGEVDFYQAAEQRFLAETRSLLAETHSKHSSGDIFARIQRGQAPLALGAAIFAASPGEVVGPIRTEAGYALVRILSMVPACLDEPTCRTIKKLLFEEWLAERRQAATIEWYWGDAGRTSQTV